MLENPVFWVAVAFFCFVGLSYKKASKLLTTSLDERSAKIQFDLDQARNLREEAERVLADYKRKQAEYMKEAESILTKARADAAALSAQAEQELKASMDARTKQALDKIAREEEQAIKEVRHHVVDIALSAARSIITDQIASLSQEDMVKLALADIDRKIH